MPKSTPSAGDKSRLFYMDLLSHDIMNDDQAVLSYLELMLADPSLTPRLREYANKAISHIHTSTILVENARRLTDMAYSKVVTLKPFDLLAATVRCAAEIPTIFPNRDIKVKVTSGIRSAEVMGTNVLDDLVLSLLVNSVRLDPVDKVEVSVRLKEGTWKGAPAWTIEVEDMNATLPAAISQDDIEGLFSKDSSVTVKMSGIMFAKLVSEGLGGDFEAEQLKPKGAVLRARFRKAGRA